MMKFYFLQQQRMKFLAVFRLLYCLCLPAFLSGCQTEFGAMNALSLDEAKEYSAQFQAPIVSPPPRSLNDITNVIEQSEPKDPQEIKGIVERANQAPPTTIDAESLASFYFYRAKAAHALGRAEQERQDYKLAVQYGEQSNFPYLDNALWFWGIAEKESGNFSVAFQAMIKAAKKSEMMGVRVIRYTVLSQIYAKAGDIKEAKSCLGEAEFLQELIKIRFLTAFQKAKINSSVNLAKGTLLDSEGKALKGEKFHRRAISEFEPYKRAEGNLGVDAARNTDVYNWMLARLVENLIQQGKLVEAEVVARKAVQNALAGNGRYSTNSVEMVRKLISVLLAQGRFQEAELLARVNLKTLQEMRVEPYSLRFALTRMMIGNTLLAQGRWYDALTIYDQVKKDVTSKDPESYYTRIAKNLDIVFALVNAGRGTEALEMVKPKLENLLTYRQENDFKVALFRAAYAMALASEGELKQALDEFHASIPVLIYKRFSQEGSRANTRQGVHLGFILEAYIDLLDKIQGTAIEKAAGIDAIDEAFKAVDFLKRRSVQRSLAASSARATVRDPELAAIARQEQDLKRQITASNDLLSEIMNLPAGQQDKKNIKILQKQIHKLQLARQAFVVELAKRFPEYAQLMYPAPVTLKEVQAKLYDSEALLVTFSGEKATYVWIVSPKKPVLYYKVAVSRDELAQKVHRLRLALDPQVTLIGDIPRFDVQTAYSLYEAILKKGEATWKQSKNILAVCDGSLGFLPLSLLPTKPTVIRGSSEVLFDEYKNIPWLAKSHAVTAVPSVSSIMALRHSQEKPQNHARSFIGIGDPVFSLVHLEEQVPKGKGLNPVSRGTSLLRATRGISMHENSAKINMLPRLPDTANELQNIASILSADPAEDLFLQKNASEELVKSLDLFSVKVIAFATHGLIPGDLDGLRQPALALSNPAITGEGGDGLLTLGEILELRLNADWVVLSACNTAAGDGAGAEAVSGLGRAFFYAGTRALLVSNWPVETTSALKITTKLFEFQRNEPEIGRAEALRKSMLFLINSPGFKDDKGKIVFSYAHPIFWAPFSLVGDGGV